MLNRIGFNPAQNSRLAFGKMVNIRVTDDEHAINRVFQADTNDIYAMSEENEKKGHIPNIVICNKRTDKPLFNINNLNVGQFVETMAKLSGDDELEQYTVHQKT